MTYYVKIRWIEKGASFDDTLDADTIEIALQLATKVVLRAYLDTEVVYPGEKATLQTTITADPAVKGSTWITVINETVKEET